MTPNVLQSILANRYVLFADIETCHGGMYVYHVCVMLAIPGHLGLEVVLLSLT